MLGNPHFQLSFGLGIVNKIARLQLILWTTLDDWWSGSSCVLVEEKDC